MPRALLNFPLGQKEQLVAPVKSAYFPAPQRSQLADPTVAAFLPTSQSVHCEASVLDVFPATQSEQEGCPTLPWYLPGVQALQSATLSCRSAFVAKSERYFPWPH